MSTPNDAFTALLSGFSPDPRSTLSPTIQKALLVARHLQERARELQTPPERRQQAELDRMLHSPTDKVTLVEMTDQAFRSTRVERTVDQFVHILDVQGIPRFFSPFERTLLRGFQSFGGYAPGVAVPLVKDRMRKETANVIVPAEPDLLYAHLRERGAEGVRMNVNFLGEAILGEQEAYARLQMNLAGLQADDVEVISIKISTLYSQISAIAREHTIATLSERLELLYREAAHLVFVRPDGTATPKFVYLDMEDYRDVSLTVEVFMRTLERAGLQNVAAGIALQAYLPDSYRHERVLLEWARRRAANGGAPITIRLVKGANMQMERVEASQRGWPQATYTRKRDTDANFKRMLHEALLPENREAVRLGIASHNLFDLAYALVLAHERDALSRVTFEMLEGMANPQRRALFELTPNLLLYAPVCHKESFLHAIGYLIRRLDENTGQDNFLRHAFRLAPDSADWQRLERAFVDSLDAIESLSDAPRRAQDRTDEPLPASAVADGWQHLVNEPGTDFCLPHNAGWAEDIVRRWEPRCGENATEIPLVIAGERVNEARPLAECLDPSRPGVVVGRYARANAADIDRAVRCATADHDGWRTLCAEERFERLGDVAHEIRRARADLIGAAIADGGKTIAESDPEVSEAVDFLELYRDSARWWQRMPTLSARPKGVVVVVSPWNFPIAIPCGGVAAALAAGNTVILKPASDAVLVAWVLCQCFYRAGISNKTLQLVPCSGAAEGTKLVTHPAVSAVILTGGTETALGMLRDQPAMRLSAETGGKNATIVTAMADRDLAIKHVVHSAFSHSGQKCSATSLLLLEAEVYDDPKFQRALADAVHSIPVGSAWSVQTKMGPLIRPPSGDLEAGLKVLEPGESWAVLPHRKGDNPSLYTPGVKYGVEPGSVTHMTELFGPLLGVMRFEKLDEAIDLVNRTGYGLTAGLESLDDREQERWQRAVRAGNLYVNRPTVGAIALRQPFGGMGKSAFGPGIKTGGPNYVAQFMDFEDAATPPAPTEPDGSCEVFVSKMLADLPERPAVLSPHDVAKLHRAARSYARAMTDEFGRAHDHFRLVGQDNLRRYLPVRELRIRIHERDGAFDIFARVAAARTVGCRITVSVPPALDSPAVDWLEEITEDWAAAIEFVEETDQRLAAVLDAFETERIRYAAEDRVPEIVLRAAAENAIYVASQPVVCEGRLELLRYVQEQSLSYDYHRYGNLGPRAEEERAAVG